MEINKNTFKHEQTQGKIEVALLYLFAESLAQHMAEKWASFEGDIQESKNGYRSTIFKIRK